ncbi:MAG: sugar phosphate isomerase/epimerase [Proteobacteria bacterium]|nr:sugar phosphate isomerase/epimerase [Pseudomonadota bacterium]
MELLGQSFKNSYLFKLGTTSFIYPDLYSVNVRNLAPFLDEVELLFFESREANSLPDDYEIRELVALKNEWGVSYNIHMPTDVDISAVDPAERERAVETYCRVFDLTRPLEPSTLTLHVPYSAEKHGGPALWQAYATKGIRSVLDHGIDPRLISVETLDYPIDMLKPLIEKFDLSVCLDVGHVFLYGGDPLSVYKAFKNRISIMHLHGVYQGCDHVSLDLMTPYDFRKVRVMLEDFTGTLSLEIFSFDNLKRSLDYLKEML